MISISAEQVRETVSMADAVAAVRQGFVDLAAGDFEMPIRTALRDGQLLDMAATTARRGRRSSSAQPELRRTASPPSSGPWCGATSRAATSWSPTPPR